jgi:hypothetical protein
MKSSQLLLLSTLFSTISTSPLARRQPWPARVGYLRWQSRCLTLVPPDPNQESNRHNIRFKLDDCSLIDRRVDGEPARDSALALATWGWALYGDRIAALAELIRRDNDTEPVPGDEDTQPLYLTASPLAPLSNGCWDRRLLSVRTVGEVAQQRVSDLSAGYGQDFAFDAANGWIVWKRDLESLGEGCEPQLCYKVNGGPKSTISGADMSVAYWPEPDEMEMLLTQCVKGDAKERWEFVESNVDGKVLKKYFQGMD